MHPAAGLHVIEMEDGNVYLGVLQYDGEWVTVHTGLVGRPATFPVWEIEDLIPAENYPGVSWESV